MFSDAGVPIPRNRTEWDCFPNKGSLEQTGSTDTCWMLRTLTLTPTFWTWVLHLLWENAMAARKGCASEAADESSHVGVWRKRKRIIVPTAKWQALETALNIHPGDPCTGHPRKISSCGIPNSRASVDLVQQIPVFQHQLLFFSHTQIELIDVASISFPY